MSENQWEITSDHSCRIFLKDIKHLIHKIHLQDVKIDYHPNLWWYISSEVVGWQIPESRQHRTLLIFHLTSSVSQNQGSIVILCILYYAQAMYWDLVTWRSDNFRISLSKLILERKWHFMGFYVFWQKKFEDYKSTVTEQNQECGY